AGRPACVLFGWESTAHPFMWHQTYDKISQLPFAERVAELRKPEVRAAMLAEEPDLGGIAAFLTMWNRLFPLGDPPQYEPGPDESIQAIADRAGRDPREVVYDAMMEQDGRALLYFPILGYAKGDFDDL